MYLGLVALPWAIFFGVSGVLFNHPNIAESLEKRFVPASELEAKVGLTPADPAALAAEVVAAVSATTSVGLRLDDDYDARFSGWSLFQAASPKGRHIMLVDLEAGVARVATRQGAPAPELASFSGLQVDLPGRNTKDTLARMRKLPEALGLDVRGPVVTNLRAGPELRFRVVDGDGRRWNAIYNLGTAQIEARALDSAPELGVVDSLGRLHKTHHFPVEMGPKFLWALFADLTGLVFVIWGLTGLAMWWQMKKKRTVGDAVLVVGLLFAAPIFLGVLDEITFGDVRKPSGPGPEPPRFDRNGHR